MQLVFRVFWVLGLGLCLSQPSWSASSAKRSLYKQAFAKKKGRYIRDGVVTGGRISKGFTLLNVRSGVSKKSKMERVVFDIGDLTGRPIKNELAYYHINVDSKARQIVIDLNQVARSGVNQDEIRQIFAKSPYVRKADIVFDPEDLTTSIYLKLKRQTKVEVFDQVSTKTPSRIVLDMMPVKKAKKRRKSRARKRS